MVAIITNEQQARDMAEQLSMKCQELRHEISTLLAGMEMPGDPAKREQLLNASRQLEEADNQVRDLIRAINEFQAARTPQPEDRP